MSPTWLLFLLFLRTAELRHAPPGSEASEWPPEDAGVPAAGSEAPRSLRSSSPEPPGAQRRLPRGARGRSPGRREPHTPASPGGRQQDPDGFFTSPRTGPSNASSGPPGSSGAPGLLSPLFPASGASSSAYLVMLLALVLFAAGIVGNLALMCIVWHNVYLKSTWNCVLAGLAFWDFLVLFFCLPVVVFHELTLRRLLGDLSCRLVPYLEVTSLGVTTFSLCALSIDRFHAATSPGYNQSPKVEPCQSILSKLSVIWVGSLVLAAPELLLWQLLQETVDLPALPTDLQQRQPGGALMAAFRARTDKFRVDVCVREPSVELPDSIYSLVLTYHEARMWWFFGCYICLPLLFTLACDLVTRQVLAQREQRKPGSGTATGRCSSSSSSSPSAKKKQHVREQRLRSTVMALTTLYVTCNLPESICNITLAYVSHRVTAALPALTLPALGLLGQFLLFLRCSAAPVLLLFLCRSLGQAFMDCCCCCCEECLPDGGSSSSSSASTTATSNLSSPASPSPSSLSPSSLSPSSLSPSSTDESKSVLVMAPAVCYDRAKDASTVLGTPC